MDDKEMQEALKQAAAIVDAAKLPDDLRQAAFNRALDHLIGAAEPAKRPTTPRKRRRSRSTKPGAAAGTRRPTKGPKKAGPQSLMKDLAAEGFFDTPRVLSDIQQRLKTRGYTYKPGDLSPGLTRLTKQKILTRDYVEGKKGPFAYQKFAK